jgi:hypothetical protein
MAMKKEEKYNRKNSTVLQLVSNAVFQSLESPGSATTFLKFFALVVLFPHCMVTSLTRIIL